MSTQIIRDGSLAGNVPEIPAFRPVSTDVFADRAARLQTLAPGHAMEGYLRFAASLTQAQRDVLRGCPDVPIPTGSDLANCLEHGLPPLSVDGHPWGSRETA